MENQIQTTANPASDFAKNVKTQINVLLNLSKQDISGNEFYERFLNGICSIIEDSGGLVWQVYPDRVGLLGSFSNSGSNTFSATGIDAQHLLAIQTTGLQGETAIASVSPNDPRIKLAKFQNEESQNGGPTQLPPASSILYRLIQDGKSAIVLELVCDSKEVDQNQTSIKRIFPAFQELAQDFHRNSELTSLRRKNYVGDQLVEFAELLCSDLDPNQTAFEVANSAVRILNVDQAVVATQKNGKLDLIAVSGVSSIDQKADASVRILKAMNQALAAGLPYVHESVAADHETNRDDGERNHPTRPANAFVTKNNDPSFAVYSIHQATGTGASATNSRDNHSNPQVLLYVETAEATRVQEIDESVLQKFVKLSSLKVQQSKRNSQRKIWFQGSSSGWLLSRAWVVTAFALIVLLVLVFFPAELKIRATGQIVPVVQRGIYSPADGGIVEVLVNHNDPVRIGDPLVRIHSSGLNFELAKLLGENKATTEKLQAIESRQITNPNRSTNPDGDFDSLSTSVVELRIIKQSQLARIKILKEKIDELTVRSPINGRVITWQVEKLLDARRVRQGQLLMTVADTDGNWHGELEINDSRMGHVLQAYNNNNKEPLKVSFVFVSNPDLGCSGKISSIDQSTKENLIGTPVVNAIAEFDFVETIEQRPGAKIVANIYCGRSSLGYVWFHELIDSARASLF